jgi:predicted Zn-dependent protease
MPQPTQPAPPATTALPPPVFGSFDATGSITNDYMHREPPSVMGELIGTLVPSDRSKVQGIPLQIVEDPKDVNAFATCDKSGGAFVAVTAPLLLIMAKSSEARAYDEMFGSAKYNDLANGFAQQVKAQSTVTGPAAGFLPLPQALDPRKLARQNQLFDEQLAFVVGHELAHHYRGHTGCTNGAASTNTITPQDIGRLLSSSVPIFNQPNEIQADVEGTYSLLDTGSKRQGAKWTEEGAVMTLDFFSRLESLGVETVLLGFLMTHPAPQLRLPIVQNAAQQWRNNGGKPPFRF